MQYWDASAIVPLLVAERRSPTMLASLEHDATIVTWWGTRIECTSAIARLEREGALDPPRVTTALASLARLARGWHEMLPSEDLRETACRLLRTHSLRAADAMQLAAACVMAAHRPAGAAFLALDDRLRQAADREGFVVGP